MKTSRPYSQFAIDNEEIDLGIDLLSYSSLLGLAEKLAKYRIIISQLRPKLFTQLDNLSEEGPGIEDVGIICDAIEKPLDERIQNLLTQSPSDKKAFRYGRPSGSSLKGNIYNEMVFHFLMRDLDQERRIELLTEGNEYSYSPHQILHTFLSSLSKQEKEILGRKRSYLFDRDQTKGIAYQRSGLYQNRGDKNERAKELEKRLGWDFGGYKFIGEGVIEGSHYVNATLNKTFGLLRIYR
tara:strand:- start:1542 stop:2258 length:717 start_codon:yes stop_codon:yes gene_type:complete